MHLVVIFTVSEHKAATTDASMFIFLMTLHKEVGWQPSTIHRRILEDRINWNWLPTIYTHLWKILNIYPNISVCVYVSMYVCIICFFNVSYMSMNPSRKKIWVNLNGLSFWFSNMYMGSHCTTSPSLDCSNAISDMLGPDTQTYPGKTSFAPGATLFP